MASEKLTLSEKGFGSREKGAASILADKMGKPLFLKLVTLPNGHIGGQAVAILPAALKPKFVRSFMNQSEEIYELKIRHQAGVGAINLKLYKNIEIIKTFEAGLVISQDICRVLSSIGMENSEEAKELLEGEVLNNAFQAALNRSLTPIPDTLFYGRPAIDGGFVKLDYYPKDKAKM